MGETLVKCFEYWEFKEHVCTLPLAINIGAIARCNKCKRYWVCSWAGSRYDYDLYNRESRPKCWKTLPRVIGWVKVKRITRKNKKARGYAARPC